MIGKIYDNGIYDLFLLNTPYCKYFELPCSNLQSQQSLRVQESSKAAVINQNNTLHNYFDRLTKMTQDVNFSGHFNL